MKIYIAGKITGDPDYKEKFAEVAEELRQRGDSVMNPACLSEDKEFCWDDYMAITAAMQQVCDATVLLPDWQDSRGATIEAHNAKRLGQKIFLFEVGLDGGFIPFNPEDRDKAVCRRCHKDLYRFIQEFNSTYCPWCGEKIVSGKHDGYR